MFAGEQVGFVADEQHGLVFLVALGGEEVLGLVDQRGRVESGGGAEGEDEVHVQPAAADGGVGQVDDGEPGGVQL